jgi:hypothetical protein
VWIVHVVSLRRSRGSEVEDDQSDGIGCDVVQVGRKYHSLVMIFLLAHRAF